jgi:LAGLIDADG endonuclease
VLVDARINRVPPNIGNYLAGFTDGEGSFNVSFRPREDYPVPWKISLSFNVSQKDRVILALFKRYLGCGTLRGRPDGVWYYETTNLTALTENVLPFFERFPFLSAKKKRDFGKFKQIVALVKEGEHLRADGIRKILEIRESMNDGGKRRHSHADILATLTESSETIRQAPPSGGDEIVRSPSRDGGPKKAAHEGVRNVNERS